jgi:hypothetical protein
LATGGAVTLTGALNGTSASFSGSVIVGTTALLNFGPTTSFVGMSGNNSTGSLSLYANNTQVLGFAASTGAATFSSSASGGQNLRLQTSVAAGRNYVQWANPSGDMGYIGYGGADGKFYIVNQLNDDMLFYTNSLPRLTIAAGGNVGIGTASPSFKLDIEGTSVIARVSDPNTSGTNRAGGYRAQTNTSTGDFLSIANNANAPFNSNDGVYVMNRTSGSNLYFTTNNGGIEAERMRITSGGNVELTGSIKTGNPSGDTAMPFKVGTVNNESDKSFAGNILKVEVNGVIYRLMIAE